LLWFVGAETWRRHNSVSATLVLWIVSELFCWAVLNHNLSARRFLPIAPAVAILLVRRLEATGGNSLPNRRLLWPLVLSAGITLNVAVADCRLANSTRNTVAQIAVQYKPTSQRLWFSGGYGAFQYYMEKLGGRRIDVERSLLQPGDIVVVPWFNNATVGLPPASVGWVEILQGRPGFWINPYGFTENSAAGFYGADLGPVPFVIGRLPDQDYYVVKVFSPIQYATQPANPDEVQAGSIPIFTNIFYAWKPEPMFTGKPESVGQVQLAAQFEAEGKIAEAIQSYRRALAADTNDPVVLNNLAWILATAKKPELRNGPEAVLLARRAVALTDIRLPQVVGTLAAADAEAGQPRQACAAASVARALALITGQKDVAAANERLIKSYSAGRVTGMTNAR